MFLCPDCLREHDRVLRQIPEAAAWHRACVTDVDVDPLYWGDEEEIDRICLELTRMQMGM